MRGSAAVPAFLCMVGAALLSGCEEAEAARKGGVATTPAVEGPSSALSGPSVTAATPEEAGRYLIEVAGCNDCHTDGYMPTNGAVPESQWLKGSAVGFRGPWGTTYPSNLRLTAASMNEDEWVAMLGSRKTMPPMPWPSVAAMTEGDRRAIYRYIRGMGEPGEPEPENLPPGQEPETPWFDFVPRNMPAGAMGPV